MTKGRLVILITLLVAFPGRGSAMRPQMSSVMISVAPGAVMPEAIEFEGPVSGVVSLEGRESVPAELVPGKYSLTRWYAGAVRTDSIEAVVSPQQTSIALPTEPVGGVQISLGVSTCWPGEAQFRIERTQQDSAEDELITTTRTKACTLAVGGLLPGHYNLRRIRGSGRELEVPRTTFVVKPQAWVTLTLQDPPICLRGVVLIGDRPIENQRIRFDQRDVRANAVTATDGNGSFAVGLSKIGTYRVFVDGLQGIEGDTVAIGQPGEHEATFRIPLGRLAIETVGGQGAKEVLVERLGGKDADARIVTLRHDQESTSIYLDPGNYGIWARTRTQVSAYRQITTDDGEQSVSLPLRVTTATLAILDSQGRAVVDATADFGKAGETLPQVKPGTYSLARVAKGVSLVIQSPSAGVTCHIVGDEVKQVAVIPPSALTDLECESGGGKDTVVGRIGNMPGADCDVPLQKLSRQTERRDYGFRVRVTLPLGSLTFRRGTQSVSVIVLAKGSSTVIH